VQDIDSTADRHADHRRAWKGHKVRLSPSANTRISPSDRRQPTAPHTSAPTANRTAPSPPRRSFGSRWSPVARAAPFEPRTAALTDRKVAARFVPNPTGCRSTSLHTGKTADLRLSRSLPPKSSRLAFCVNIKRSADGVRYDDNKPVTARVPAAVPNRQPGSSSRPAPSGCSLT